jgi:hypothetical protein
VKEEDKKEEKKEEEGYKFEYTHIFLVDQSNLFVIKFGRKKIYCKKE